jgi:sugar phosphate isomerase/epimerase
MGFVTLHPRVSVSQECSPHQSFTDDVSMWRRLDIDRVGLISTKLRPAGWDARLVTDAGIKVTNVGAEVELLEKALECAETVGADVVWTCTGPLGSRSWDEAADDFCKRIIPAATQAKEKGIVLAIEPTNPLRTDVSFIHTMRDTFDLAHAAGIGVLLDFAMCWYERGLTEIVRENLDSLSLVQINDYRIGTFSTPDRSVLGDGDIPLERLLTMLVEAGYSGMFDLEIIGPKIEEEGYVSSIRRSLDRLNEILARLDV